MAKYRKKPVVIEATQWFPGVEHVGVRYNETADAYYVVTIPTWLEAGDWILPGPKEGHFYPCKPEVFAATYEPVDHG